MVVQRAATAGVPCRPSRATSHSVNRPSSRPASRPASRPTGRFGPDLGFGSPGLLLSKRGFLLVFAEQVGWGGVGWGGVGWGMVGWGGVGWGGVGAGCLSSLFLSRRLEPSFQRVHLSLSSWARYALGRGPRAPPFKDPHGKWMALSECLGSGIGLRMGWEGPDKGSNPATWGFNTDFFEFPSPAAQRSLARCRVFVLLFLSSFFLGGGGRGEFGTFTSFSFWSRGARPHARTHECVSIS